MAEDKRRGPQLKIPKEFWIQRGSRRVLVEVAAMSNKEMLQAAQQWKDSGEFRDALDRLRLERRDALEVAAGRRREFWQGQRDQWGAKAGEKVREDGGAA